MLDFSLALDTALALHRLNGDHVRDLAVEELSELTEALMLDSADDVRGELADALLVLLQLAHDSYAGADALAARTGCGIETMRAWLESTHSRLASQGAMPRVEAGQQAIIACARLTAYIGRRWRLSGGEAYDAMLASGGLVLDALAAVLAACVAYGDVGERLDATVARLRAEVL